MSTFKAVPRSRTTTAAPANTRAKVKSVNKLAPAPLKPRQKGNILTVLAKIADLGLLSKVEELKLLSRLEETGVLSKVERAGLLTFVEKSGILKSVADPVLGKIQQL